MAPGGKGKGKGAKGGQPARWVTINGAAVPVDGKGRLMGAHGERILRARAEKTMREARQRAQEAAYGPGARPKLPKPGRHRVTHDVESHQDFRVTAPVGRPSWSKTDFNPPKTDRPAREQMGPVTGPRAARQAASEYNRSRPVPDHRDFEVIRRIGDPALSKDLAVRARHAVAHQAAVQQTTRGRGVPGVTERVRPNVLSLEERREARREARAAIRSRREEHRESRREQARKTAEKGKKR